MKDKKLWKIFDYRGKYILHVILIVLSLFGFYYLGDALLDFQSGTTFLKMFFWFILSLWISDGIWEKILGV